jgi:hypothetical protein
MSEDVVYAVIDGNPDDFELRNFFATRELAENYASSWPRGLVLEFLFTDVVKAQGYTVHTEPLLRKRLYQLMWRTDEPDSDRNPYEYGHDRDYDPEIEPYGFFYADGQDREILMVQAWDAETLYEIYRAKRKEKS